MAGPHSPLGPSTQLLPGMADWSRVMRSRSRCCRAAYVRVSELPSRHCFLLVKASHKASPYSSPLPFFMGGTSKTHCQGACSQERGEFVAIFFYPAQQNIISKLLRWNKQPGCLNPSPLFSLPFNTQALRHCFPVGNWEA